ncbi:MAG: BREX-4 system phosphatase PglZ [Nitrososphaerota archaeon]
MNFKKIHLEKFKDLIISDLNSYEYARFPLRLILVEDIYTLKEISREIKIYVDKVIKLSDYCKNNESLPEIGEIFIDIKNALNKGEKILCLMPEDLIEILGEGFLEKLIAFETDPTKNTRIYLAVFKISNKIKNIIEKQKDIGKRKAPPIKVDTPLMEKKFSLKFYIFYDKKVFELLSDIKEFIKREFELIKGFSDYLKFWENLEIDEAKNILVFSEILYKEKQEMEGEISFLKINNLKELLEKIFNYFISLKFQKEDECYWEKLAKDLLLSKNENFQEFLMKKFNVNKVDKTLLYKWKELGEYERWLLYNWIKPYFLRGNSYLSKVLELSRSYKDFEELIWNTIINEEKISFDWIKERIELIKKMHLEKPLNFYKLLENISDPLRKITLLPGINSEEKLEIIKNLALYFQFKNDYIEILQFLELNYPELAYYLSFSGINNSLDQYFSQYIKAKIMNSPSILFELEEKAKEINIFSFSSRNEKLEKCPYKQIWIDGLGTEWLILLVKWLINRGYIVEYEVVRANMPTTTEFNPIPENAIRFPDLDEIYHRQDREYPDFILEEIEKIINMLEEKIEPLIKKYGEVVITSDHGSTRFSGWLEEKINFEELEIYNFGRFAKWNLKDLPQLNDEFYIERYKDDYYLISKTHKVFKGGKRVKIENHGGGTLEEVLVPIIYVTSKKLTSQIPEIKLLNKEISFLEPVLEIEIKPESRFVEIIFLDNLLRKEGEKISEFVWRFDLSLIKRKLESKEYKIKIKCNLGEKEELLKIKSGLEEEELFEEV